MTALIDTYSPATATATGTAQAGITADAADLVFREARTAYRFTDEPVSAADLERIHDLLRHPPTAVNSQPLRVVLATTEAARGRVLPFLAEGNRAKAATAPVIAILAADTEFHEHLPRLLPQAPGAKERFAADAAHREESARFNATLQAGYFLLAVRAVGLDAGPMGGFDRAGVDRELLGNGALRSLLVVNIGHAAPDGSFPRNPRLERDEVFTFLG